MMIIPAESIPSPRLNVKIEGRPVQQPAVQLYRLHVQAAHDDPYLFQDGDL